MSSNITLKSPLVSVEWLHNHLDAEDLIVLDGTINKVFDASKQQIPNTRFFDIKKKFSNASDPFPSAFPETEQFQIEARALGINNDSAIVVYDDKGIYSSARVWWLFKAFGFHNVAVLDGGFPAWQKADYKTESSTMYKGGLGDFKAKLNPDMMVFFEDMKTISDNKTRTIIDARSKARFNCEAPEPREGLRMGTIPNSVNLPFADLLVDGVMISPDAMKSKFSNLVIKDDALVFSCGSGLTACVLALGAEMSGYKNIAVYDGSWTEWGSLVDN